MHQDVRITERSEEIVGRKKPPGDSVCSLDLFNNS
jgi:hypothetical protein